MSFGFWLLFALALCIVVVSGNSITGPKKKETKATQHIISQEMDEDEIIRKKHRNSGIILGKKDPNYTRFPKNPKLHEPDSKPRPHRIQYRKGFYHNRNQLVGRMDKRKMKSRH